MTNEPVQFPAENFWRVECYWIASSGSQFVEEKKGPEMVDRTRQTSQRNFSNVTGTPQQPKSPSKCANVAEHFPRLSITSGCQRLSLMSTANSPEEEESF